jgi:hypothetical protein
MRVMFECGKLSDWTRLECLVDWTDVDKRPAPVSVSN